jgi:hypothetical protein
MYLPLASSLHSGEQQQWPPMTEITSFKKVESFIKFPFICLNNLKFVERKK